MLVIIINIQYITYRFIVFERKTMRNYDLIQIISSISTLIFSILCIFQNVRNHNLDRYGLYYIFKIFNTITGITEF